MSSQLNAWMKACEHKAAEVDRLKDALDTERKINEELRKALQGIKMKHTLISIGWLGGYSCYLDLPIDECKRRYRADNPGKYSEEDSENVRSFEFDDEFCAYEVYPK